MKNKLTPQQKLRNQIKKMLESHHPDEIFTALVSATESDSAKLDYLKDEAKLFLQIYANVNIVRADTMIQQMAIEEALVKIIPYHNQQQEQLLFKM